jgi:hypothetical protein
MSDKADGDMVLKTVKGTMLGKGRPAIVADVLENYSLVVELGRRDREYFYGLSLRGLLEHRGVILDLDADINHHTLFEHRGLFRSNGEPLRVAAYHRNSPRRLSGLTVVQPHRVHAKAFNSLCLPRAYIVKQ